MALNLLLPEPPDDPNPVVTGLMRRTVNRTVTAIPTGGLGVWSGRSRIGKSTTAQWFVRQLEGAYDPADPRTYRGFYFEVGEIRAGAGNEQKRAIAGLHYQLLRAPVSDGEYRRLPPEGLAERLVGTLRRTGRRVLLIDEAGNLSLQAIRGLVLVRDVAEQLGWPTSIVFVGMDDLPTKIEEIEQIKNRVHAWCYFEEYSATETRKLLAALHPHFRPRADGGEAPAGAAGEAALAEEAAYVHQHFGGFPGKIVPFLHQVDAYVRTLRQPISLAVLIAVREFLLRDRDRAVDDAANGYRQRPAVRNDESKNRPKQQPKNRPRGGRKNAPQRDGASPRSGESGRAPRDPGSEPPSTERGRGDAGARPPQAQLPSEGSPSTDDGDGGEGHERNAA